MFNLKSRSTDLRVLNAAESPLRSEILTRAGLVDYARMLAERHRVKPSRRGASALLTRLEQNSIVLDRVYVALSQAAENKDTLSSGAAWLLDNYHIIKERVRDLRRDFPRGYYQSLPKLTEGEHKKHPRVYSIALEIVMHTDATIDSDLVAAFIEAYQTQAVLTSGELWAIPIMLRFALIENLRRLTVNTLTAKEQSKLAEMLVEDIVGPETHSSTDILLMLASKLNENPDFLPIGAVSLMRRLREKGSKSALTLQWLEARLKEQGQDPEEMARIEQYAQAANQASIGNTVTSLKHVSEINWQDWFERVSLVHQTLLNDPAGAYIECDFLTRDHYRHRIERLARGLRISEVAIAEATVELAKEFGKESQEKDLSDQTLSELDEGGIRRYSHVGYYLVDKGRAQLDKRLDWRRPIRERLQLLLEEQAFPFYIGSILVLSLGLATLLFGFTISLGGALPLAGLAAILFLFPLSELATNIVQWLETNRASPTRLPKLDFESGIPSPFRTIVTVQAIFHDKLAIENAVQGLEVRFLANDDPNLYFALLADLRDAPSEQMPGDEELIASGKALIAELNERHFVDQEQRFFILFRHRVWNPRQEVFMGWERKRGKISEFNRLLLGADDTSFLIEAAEQEILRKVNFVITLDGDSTLPRGVAGKLIGTLAHPLNRPVFDKLTNVVREGYGVIQPRVTVGFGSANVSQFASTFSGNIGLDPYTQLISDVYQDLFREGSYIGKGIYDVRAFERALSNRVPDNTMLSHDLFEGCFARVALATDIEIFDDFPSRYEAFSKRLYRWVRGDWQLFPWIFGRIPDGNGKSYVSPISPLGRWKMFDNLRRSLVAPALFLFISLALTILPGSPLNWLLIAAIVITFPIYSIIANALIHPPKTGSARAYFLALQRDVLRQSKQTAMTLSFLPYQAYLMIQAVTLTLFRVFITKKNLLVWESAYHTESQTKDSLGSYLILMSPGVGLTVILTAALSVWSPAHLGFATPLILLWTAAPFLAYWISKPISQDSYNISETSRERLWLIGWESWRYFDELMTAEHNYLVPDNLQLEPHTVVASRTSPTNISLSILSLISAYDMGFLPLNVVAERLKRTFDTLSKLERFRGHFLNWYQTRTLTPLEPRYVSTVDSGNLVGHMIAAQTAFQEFRDSAFVTERHWKFISLRLSSVMGQLKDKDNILIPHVVPLRAALAVPPTNGPQLRAALTAMEEFVARVSALRNPNRDPGDKAVSAIDSLISDICQIMSVQNALGEYLALDEKLERIHLLIQAAPEAERAALSIRLEIAQGQLQQNTPTPRQVAEAARLCSTLLRDAELYSPKSIEASPAESTGRDAVIIEEQILTKVDEHLKELSVAAHNIINVTELNFLYDSKKELFAIGYHIDSGQRDNSFYDLLASESRLASFVAVATDAVPQKHWFSLGRSLVSVSGSTALVSWSGTMFEYLMPLLVMREYEGTLLSTTSHAVVHAQQEYAAARGTPWGLSESAYSAVDFEKTYQYKAFGVPSLGLKRGLADDVVVSPYSTFLALMVAPEQALVNISALEQAGLRGEYGFYEAIDFTAERLSKEEDSHIIRSFLAHHQGMTLVSINNVLNSKVMVERFHADQRVRATELLLQERFPHHVPAPAPIESTVTSHSKWEEEDQRVAKGEIFSTPHTLYPRTRVLSNGHYTVMVDNAGNGFSAFDGELMLTRWREDCVAGQYGNYIFVRDLDTGKLWSVAYQPTRVEPETYEVLFNPDKIEFIRRDFGIRLHTVITVSPEDNVEVRQVTLTNLSNRKRSLEVTSYAEVALAFGRADIAHPAFSKMFIETEYHAECEALIFSRRPRSKHEERLYLMHMITQRSCWAPTQYETSRMAFLGRGNSIGNAACFDAQIELTGSTGPVLDPIYSLRARVELDESQSEVVVFSTGFAKSREGILNLSQRYHDLHSVTRAFEIAWSHNNIELRREEYSIRQMLAFQRLITALIYNLDGVRGKRDALESNRLTQSGFWRFGVSGDLPIVLLRVNDPTQIKLVREALYAHQYARLRGIIFDLVILNEYPGGYFQNFQEELEFLVRSGFMGGLVDQKGGVYLRTQIQLSAEEVTLLEAVARVVLKGENGSLSTQLKLLERAVENPYHQRPAHSERDAIYSISSVPKNSYEFYNGFGGFVDQGRAYQIELADRKLPPLPWSNVIANRDFGFVVTESGGGYTWSENSRENKITPWRNDPVSDPIGEVLYLRDAEHGQYWSPTPRPVTSKKSARVRHGFGYSEFLKTESGIDSCLSVSGSSSEKVKWWQIKLKNRTERERRIEAYLYVEWTLGIQREESVRSLVSNFDKPSSILYACNHYNNEFAGRVVFVGSSLPIVSYTTSRSEFIGRHGDVGSPQALYASESRSRASFVSSRRAPAELSRKVGSGFDTCAVLKVELTLLPKEEREFLFYLSEAGSIEEARRLGPRYRSLDVQHSELTRVKESWESTLSAVQVSTPDRSFDILINGWLLYQTLSCRVNGRSAIYQSGGALGFRDQLQDVLALLYSRPEIARSQILLHAAHQFPEGDVQHWWHPPTGRGVRTRISDDYLWLPYVVHRYIQATGDFGILDEQVQFIDAPKLEEHQMEAYIQPQVSAQAASIYEHCTIALDRALPVGVHGLPLMGAGDWNDGMNEVGHGGTGESVWLGWFLSDCLRRFAEISTARSDEARAGVYLKKSEQLIQAIEHEGWDGEWYRRAFFDDGTPLGSTANDECRIDSLSQSWSVITGSGNPERRIKAMDAVRRELVRPKEKLICLLTPPFDKGSQEPGYIKGYLPGVRENGGQYTHAATWVVMATALQGKGREALELFSMINPINHTSSGAELSRYQGEPYVLCGDVYSSEPHVGRAGWSWYTGSAGWLYQVGIEQIMGLSISGESFTVNPCVPPGWTEFSISYRARNVTYNIEIQNPNGIEKGVVSIEVDGRMVPDKRVKYLANDLEQQQVKVVVLMG